MTAPSSSTEAARASVFARADHLLYLAEVAFVGAAVSIIAALLFLNVVLRYVFVAPIGWAEELCLYLIVWAVFVGCSVGIRTHSHISVDLLPLVLPPAARRLLAFCVAVLILVFLAVFFYYSGAHTLRIFQSGQLTPVMLAPMWLAYAAMPVGSALMFLRTLQVLWRILRNDDLKTPLSVADVKD
jgi:C4-dicarboxylate transporter DctQ subunit